MTVPSRLFKAVLVLALGAPLTASWAAQTPDIDVDAELRRLHEASARSAQAASAASAEELRGLVLPITDHVSAVQYCAFMLRHADATDRTSLDAARAKAGWREIESGAPETIPGVDFGPLYPTVRDEPVFTREAAGAAGSGRRVFLAPDTGVCTILTLNEPGAQARATEWLTATRSQWKDATRSSRHGWRVYAVRNPTLFQANLRIYAAVLTKGAASAGVTGLHVVAMTGLP